jgi:hypothetical protein
MLPQAFGLADPEGFDFDLLGGGFAVGGIGEFAAGNLDHVELDRDGVEGFDGFGLGFGLGVGEGARS